MRSFAIVPAAGRSRRMDRPKLMLPWQGEPLLGHVLAAWQNSRVTQIAVVLRGDDRAAQEVCERFRVEQVRAAEDPRDMKASVLLGLDYLAAKHAPRREDVWLVAPADMPQLTAASIDCVLSAFEPGDPAIVVPTSNGRGGHPVLFPWQLAEAAFELGPNDGVNRLVDRHPARRMEIGDQGCTRDIDTPADYERLIGYSRRG